MIEGPKTRAEEILGAILANPELIEAAPNLATSDFPLEDERLLFAEILRQKEEDGAVDELTLGQKTPGGQQYLQRIQTGLANKKPEVFIRAVNELKKQKHQQNLFRLLEEQTKTIKATGSDVGFEIDQIKGEIEAIEALDASRERDREIEVAPTIEELASLQIPEIDWLVEPIIERFGFSLIGAQKGVGKSLFVTQLALSAAAGTSSFLTEDIKIAKPLNALLIQQEVSLPGMKDRLFKMRTEKTFNLEGRFRQKTTTGAWWNLTNRKDYEKLLRLLEKYNPDILILDPLYTFYPKELNTSGDISPMMKILSDLKSNYNLGLVVVHHFSNKEDADEVQHRASIGRFMGHSMIANSADSTIGLDFLHPKYRQQTLPLPYQNYVMVEITTRHGEWPARFAIERRHGCLLFEKSTIWQDLGRSIVPGRIEEILEANDGGMLQKDLIGLLIKEASPTTIRRSIEEGLKQGTITKQALPGKGNPIMLRIKK